MRAREFVVPPSGGMAAGGLAPRSRNVREAVTAFYFDRHAPARVRLHLVRDEVHHFCLPPIVHRA